MRMICLTHADCKYGSFIATAMPLRFGTRSFPAQPNICRRYPYASRIRETRQEASLLFYITMQFVSNRIFHEIHPPFPVQVICKKDLSYRHRLCLVLRGSCSTGQGKICQLLRPVSRFFHMKACLRSRIFPIQADTVFLFGEGT